MNVQQQGEVYVEKIEEVPDGLNAFTGEMSAGAYVISHSESGHHHVIDAADCMVMEHPEPPAGMQILYAIVKNPASLRQNAANAHEAADLDPGIYELRIAREFDPFEEEVRRVAD